MPRLDDRELANLHAIADHLREIFGSRGHHVDSALRIDSAFDRGFCQSSLTRGLVQDAVEEGAQLVGMPRASVRGGGLELVHYDYGGYEERRYRIRKATRREDGTLSVLADNGSGLTPDGGLPDEPTLTEVSRWVYAWVPGANNDIQELVAAEVVDFIPGSPGRLVFGEEISLGTSMDPFPAGFQPTEEGLEGFDTDEGYGSAAS